MPLFQAVVVPEGGTKNKPEAPGWARLKKPARPGEEASGGGLGRP